MLGLKEEIISITKEWGIDNVGFTSRERLEDTPPSADLGYVLPGARSAVDARTALRATPAISLRNFPHRNPECRVPVVPI